MYTYFLENRIPVCILEVCCKSDYDLYLPSTVIWSWHHLQALSAAFDSQPQLMKVKISAVCSAPDVWSVGGVFNSSCSLSDTMSVLRSRQLSERRHNTVYICVAVWWIDMTWCCCCWSPQHAVWLRFLAVCFTWSSVSLCTDVHCVRKKSKPLDNIE